MNRKTFIEAEMECETVFRQSGPWHHLYTLGKSTPIILYTEDDYRFAMNLMARCCETDKQVKIAAFEFMSNHLHIIISGKMPDIATFFMNFKKSLKRYFTGKGIKLPKEFLMKTKPITDLKTLRNCIVYTNRNGYVAIPDHTPFSYPWGTGRYYFNPFPISRKLSDFNKNAKMEMFHSRVPGLSEDSPVIDGYIAPPSYCALELGMSMFRDAHQYFAMISKNVEAYSGIAAEIDDGEFLTDAELFAQITKIIRETYGKTALKELSKAQKLELAKRLHYDYRSSNGQISRTLNLSQYDIDSLFPLSKHP